MQCAGQAAPRSRLRGVGAGNVTGVCDRGLAIGGGLRSEARDRGLALRTCSAKERRHLGGGRCRRLDLRATPGRRRGRHARSRDVPARYEPREEEGPHPSDTPQGGGGGLPHSSPACPRGRRYSCSRGRAAWQPPPGARCRRIAPRSSMTVRIGLCCSCTIGQSAMLPCSKNMPGLRVFWCCFRALACKMGALRSRACAGWTSAPKIDAARRGQTGPDGAGRGRTGQNSHDGHAGVGHRGAGAAFAARWGHAEVA